MFSQVRTIAEKFPRLSLLLAHAGCSKVEEYVKIARELENVYPDLCMSATPRGLVERLFAEAGHDKIVWGFDATFINMAHQIGKVLGARLSEEDKRKLLSGNAPEDPGTGGAMKGQGEATSASLLAGHAREDITPPVGTHMMGYASRKEPCEGIHDELNADAVAVSDGARTVLLVSLDVSSLGLGEVQAVKRTIRGKTGIGPESVIVNTSHTHAGPLVAQREHAPFQAAYFAEMCGRVARAAAAALEDMRPATLEVGSAPLDIGGNRRERGAEGEIVLGVNPEGARLAEVTVWRFARNEGTDIVLFSTPLHGTTMGSENLLISAEWMGAAVRAIEESQPETSAVFLQGCAGNQNPYRDERTFERIARHGEATRDAVLEALRTALEACPLSLVNIARQVDLPCEGGGTSALPVHGLRLGDAVLVGLGGEAFVEYALYGRERSNANSTLVLGYTDGNINYLPTKAAFSEGGYETVAYRFFPGGRPLSPDVESVIRDEMARLLDDLMMGQPDLNSPYPSTHPTAG